MIFASLVLLFGAALPGAAAPISEITVVQDTLAADGIMIDVTGDGSIGPVGELLLGVSGIAPGVVMHDKARIEFTAGPRSTRYVVEGLSFDWNTHTAHGFVGALVDGAPVFGAHIDVFDLFQRPDGTFELIWTTQAANVFQQVFGSQGDVDPGDYFADALLGADPHGVPEPGTLLMMATGLLGLSYLRRRPKA